MGYAKEFFISFIFFTISSFVVLYIIYNDYNSEQELYLQKTLQDESKLFFVVKESLIVLSDVLFKERINQSEIKRVFARRDRKRLYELLKDDYADLKQLGLRQLHFHLPNMQSFLRFHRPKKYGDSLKGVRSGIELVIQTKKAVHCFEEGRIFNGFRNIYPIFYKNRYIGSVEISFSPYAIARLMQHYFPNAFYGLVLKKDVVDKKLFSDEKRNYLSIPNSKYYWDKVSFEKNRLTPEEKKILDEVIAKYDIQKSNAFAIKHKYVVITLPIQNCVGRYVGDFIILHPSKYLLKHFYLFVKYALISLLLLTFISIMLLLYLKQIRNNMLALEKAALKDPLTKIANRRAYKYFIKSLDQKQKYGIIYCDIDFFKRINDTYGHDKGDEILQKVAKTLSRFIRKDDLLARWGGEEFLMVLPNIGLEDVKNRAEKMRQAIENISKDLPVSCSFGVTVCEDPTHIEECIKRADEALYSAKKRGRNRVEVI